MHDPVLKAFTTPAFVARLRLADLHESYPANGDILVCERYLARHDASHSALPHEQRIKRAAVLCRAIRNAEAASAPSGETSEEMASNDREAGRAALATECLAIGKTSGLSVEDQIAALETALESLRTPGARAASARGLSGARRAPSILNLAAGRSAAPLDLRGVPGANRTLKAINVLRVEVPAFDQNPLDVQIREASKALRERGYLE